MNSIRKHLTLRPHGEDLLTSSGAFWLLSASLLVFTMALTESIAWMYVGSLFAEGSVSYIIALFVGIVVFSVIWIVDVSLITMDRAYAEHSNALLERPHKIKNERLKQVLTFSLRVGLLVGSLSITAPFLAQLVFKNDIVQELGNIAANSVEAKRNDLLIASAQSDSLWGAQIAAKRDVYEREVAGGGISRRFGDGPASAAILATISDLERQRTLSRANNDASVQRFDSLVRDWRTNRELLASQYNLYLPKSSAVQNYRALKQMRARNETAETERSIKAFLVLIFAGLLMLKLFEPQSIRLYLSEVLQQEYARYLAGSFDELLHPTERSRAGAKTISPQRLFEFLANTWIPTRRFENRTSISMARRVAAKRSLEELEALRSHTEHELARARAEVDQRWAQSEDAAKSVVELDSAIKAVQNDVSTFEAELRESMAKPSLNERTRLEYQTYIENKLLEARQALRDLEERVPSEAEKLDRTRAALLIAEVRCNEHRKELDQRDREIRESRSIIAGIATADAQNTAHSS